MAETKKNIMTFAGLRALEDELFDLKVYKRKEVAQKIKEAREQGDLSENAEYDAAKDEQRDIEARIEELEKLLKNVEVVGQDEVDADTVGIGSRVKLYDVEMDEEVEKGASGVVRSATFAVLIILIVFFPILTLNGIEGKYFTPMAKTLVFCIIGALILSLTYVPMMASLFLKHTIVVKPTLADRFFEQLNKLYQRCLHACLHHKARTVVIAFAALIGSLFLFTRLGAEFIPTLDEGDFAMQMTLPAGPDR